MNYRIAKDKIAGQVMFLLTITSIFLVIIMAVGLFIKSEPILRQYSLWELLTESNWRPMEGKFGFLPFLAGTFWCFDAPVDRHCCLLRTERSLYHFQARTSGALLGDGEPIT